jgi:hypothetical protein
LKSNLVDLPARLLHETDKAWKLATEMKDEVWLPKAACEFDEAEGVLTLPQSLAEEKGLV